MNMKTKFALIAGAIAVAACTVAIAEGELAPHDNEALQAMKGYRLRVVKPGEMMDHAMLPDRITVWVDANGKITAAKFQ
ncbi:MAG: hypothetical protein JO218_13095 [Burkholderiales bacterium]|nr:hypothetical protein [Burkholderiales bacterium]